jgi:hypothetical protein
MKYSSEIYKTVTDILFIQGISTLTPVVVFPFVAFVHLFAVTIVTYCSESYPSHSLKL